MLKPRSATPLLLACLLILGIWHFGSLPGDGPLVGELQSAAHFPLFGTLAVVLFLMARFHTPLGGGPAWRAYAGALVAMLAISLAAEWSQQFTDRDASLWDVAVNMAGATAALSVTALFDTRLATFTRTLAVRVGLVSCPLALALVVALPVTGIAAALAKRHADFPCIVCPTSRLDLRLLETNGASVSLTRTVNPEEYALRVHLERGPFPGVSRVYPAPDWRGYATLVLELTNPGAEPLRLTLRIDDAAHNSRFADRFNHRLLLPAQTRHQERIPLVAIENAPEGRQMDMKNVARVLLFGTGETHQRWFYVHSIRLE